MRCLSSAAGVALAYVLRTAVSSAEVSDPNFEETVLLAPMGLGGITAMAWAPDGSDRLFLTRQIGQVRLVEGGKLRAAGFASLSPILTDMECGLIGIAFDPAFVDNRFVYFFVSVSQTEQQIIRYVADGDTGVNKTVVVSGLPTLGKNHDGGALGFGPDGKLYWAIGDLGSGVGVGPNLTTLAAKVGRANPDGSVPQDNPFYDGDGPNEDRIWARGFRNPFSLAWQPSTERLWLNVVGALYEQIFTPLPGDHGGWSTYQNNQPAGFLSPIIAYRTHGADSRQLVADGSRRSKGVLTFTTKVAHRFYAGTKLTITGSSDASFDVTGYVSEVPSDLEFSIPQAGPDASAGGGLASSLEFGAAVTGGAFWDSSAVPEEYRGNFFFTDFDSGRIARVVAPPGEPGDAPTVTAVDYFASNERPIDMAVGPDGDLYYATFGGGVYRVSYRALEQAIIVSHLHVRVPEGARGVVGVRLALQPSEPTTVKISRFDGDQDVVFEPAELTFDAQNWSVPQLVTIAALEDVDGEPDRAFLEVTSADLETELVDVRVTENDEPTPESSAGAAGQPGVEVAGEAGSGGGGSGHETGSAGEGQSDGGLWNAAGAPSEGGYGGQPITTPSDVDGCGCSVPGRDSRSGVVTVLAAMLLAALRRRRASSSRRFRLLQ